MKIISKTFLACFFSVLLLASLWASLANADPCDEAEKISKERLAYDSDNRERATVLWDKIAVLRNKMNELDKGLAKIGRELVNAKGSKKDALWKQRGSLSAQKEALYKEASPMMVERSNIVTERGRKNLEYKISEVKKRYECATNEQLNKKLAAASKGDSAIVDLTKKRMSLIEGLEIEYKKYEGEVAKKMQLYTDAYNSYFAVLKNEDALDIQMDRLDNEIHDVMDGFREVLSSSRENISKISEDILMKLDK